MNIKVAIRVRPFNQRERKLKTTLCVQMQDSSVYLVDNQGNELNKFSFDYCFWSHDGFKSDKKGYMSPKDEDSSYADQQYVYNVLGKEILNNAIEGFNCCLFAYGQTGAGKSYSIFGYGPNKGIVPQVCEELISGKALGVDTAIKWKLSLSMLEIYNEKVQDLLVSVNKRPKGGLKVRENKKIGVFVEKLSKYDVKSYKEIQDLIEYGNENKSLGATLMNATSSRAHTIIILELIQRKQALKKTIQKTSQIFLVDLAGSESVKKTESKNDRLKEACSINRSLSALGKVIHQLYKKAIGKKTIISYRDSQLTRLLQNALGGNSKTTMICAISPAKDNYEETLSTLRYANQAKMIKTDAVINESETDKLIRELTSENKKLKELLKKFQNQQQTESQAKKVEDINTQINELQHEIEETQNIQDDQDEKKEQQRKITIQNVTSKIVKKGEDFSKLIHMLNLNADPMISGKNKINLQKKNVKITRTIQDEPNTIHQIVLKAVSIFDNHAFIQYKENILTIETDLIQAAENVFINGESLDNYEEDDEDENTGQEKIIYKRKLKDLDRIIIGTGSTFLIRIPNEQGILENAQVDGKDIDWEFCQQEKFELQEEPQRKELQTEYDKKKEELQQKEKLLQENMEKEKEKYQKLIKDKQEEFARSLNILQEQMREETQSFVQQEQNNLELNSEELIKSIENQQKTKELEFQLKIQQLKKESENLIKRKEINQKIQNSLIQYYPKIKEANAISEVLCRRIEFLPFVDSINLIPTQEDENSNDNQIIVKVKVLNREEGWVYYWSLEKFEERLELMREQVEEYFNYNEVLDLNEDQDPFWDPQELVLISRGFCMLKNNLYRFQINHKIGLLSMDGHIGFIKVSLIPVDDDGEKIDDEELEELIEEPSDLIEHNLSCHMMVVMDQMVIYDVSELLNKKCSLSYSIMTMNGIEFFHTPTYTITDNQIFMAYRQFINIEKVTYDIIDYYMNKKMQIYLFSETAETIEKLGKLPPPKIIEEKQLFEHNYDQRKSIDRQALKKISREEIAELKKQRKKSILKSENTQSQQQKNMCNIF